MGIETFKKQLRSQQTNPESILWYFLRAKRFFDYKLKRQASIGPYIVDFVCFQQKLIIELDGGQHNEASHKNKDLKRTAYLNSRGFQVIRFWNNDVLRNWEAVLMAIEKALAIAPPPLSLVEAKNASTRPLPQGER